MTKLATMTSTLCLALLSSGAARAQDTADLDALLSETVSTTGSKSAQASTAVPALSINLTAEDMRRYGIRTLAEAYNFLATGIISVDPLGDVDIGSRGVLLTNDVGNHILLLIDGHATNDQRNGASYHAESAGIPMALIDHIEIMLGPGSVLYGSNAMLGVVNVVTKRAKDYAGIHIIAETSLSAPIDAAHAPVSPAFTGQYLRDLGKSLRLGAGVGETFRLFGEPSEITAQIEYYALTGPTIEWPRFFSSNDNFGPRTPIGTWGGKTRDSYYQQTPSGYARVQSGDWQLTLHALTTHASMPYSRIQDFFQNFDDTRSYRDRFYGAVDLSWSKAVSTSTSMVARIYGDASRQYSQLRSSQFLGCLGSQVNGCFHTTNGHAQWLGAELQTSISWLDDRSMSTMLGFEGRVRWVGFENGLLDVNTEATAGAFGHYQATGTTAAVYAQQIYTPSSFIALNVGGRLDVDDEFGQRISPRAAATFNVWRGGTVKVIYSEAFRAPTPEELHLTNKFQVLAPPGLLPETVRSAEALIQQGIGTHRILFGVFRSWWNNMVLREIISKADLGAAQRAGLIDSSSIIVYQFRNTSRIDDYGINASYESAAMDGHLTYGANMTFAYARAHTPDGPKLMTVTPSLFGNVRASYDFAGGFPAVGIASQMSGRRLSDNSQDPGVTQLHYAAPMLDLRLTVSGAVPRITNLHYRVAADYAFTTANPYQAISSPGIGQDTEELIPLNRLTLILGLSADF
jgi:outer membrane receptor for ferrienterochelin and colicins